MVDPSSLVGAARCDTRGSVRLAPCLIRFASSGGPWMALDLARILEFPLGELLNGLVNLI